jgi:phosphatidylglycerol:prolipoprotein diacylglycerol transferase
MLAQRQRERPRGELTGWVLTLYGVFRILVEFFREPDVQIGFLAGGVTMGQLLSLPVLAGGVWLLVRARTASGSERVRRGVS